MPLKLYEHPASQPSRAIMWALYINKTEYVAMEMDLLKGHTRTPEFRKINPGHKVPTLVDDDNDNDNDKDNDKDGNDRHQPFVLFESHAIFYYLAEKYNWKVFSPLSSLSPLLFLLFSPLFFPLFLFSFSPLFLFSFPFPSSFPPTLTSLPSFLPLNSYCTQAICKRVGNSMNTSTGII